MASPVVVSRIQNRRGTQDQFEALYPLPYTSAAGATSVGNVITVDDTTGLTVNAPVSVSGGTGVLVPGTIIVSIDSATDFTVSNVPVTPLSGPDVVSVPKYDGIWGVSINLYPNILMPGELALCTDSRRVFVGNTGGQFIELEVAGGTGIELAPLVLQLPPVLVPTAIADLEIDPTPFFTFLYSITDSLNPDWNTVGTSFSKNGDLNITSLVDTGPGSATLTDTGTEINLTVYDISFSAEYNIPSDKIEIRYIHDFPTSLTFSTSTIRWLPF